MDTPNTLSAKPTPPPTLWLAPCACFHMLWCLKAPVIRECAQTRCVDKGAAINLSCSAIFWKTKEKFTLGSWVSYKNQKGNKSLRTLPPEEARRVEQVYPIQRQKIQIIAPLNRVPHLKATSKDLSYMLFQVWKQQHKYTRSMKKTKKPSQEEIIILQ